MPSLAWTHGARTDVGRMRRTNEDAFLAEPGAGLFGVADGMGGHAGGEVASRLAVRTVAETLVADGGGPAAGEESEAGGAGGFGPAARRAVEAANHAIRREAERRPALSGMGTTLTLLLLREDGRWTVAHVGDSRAYLLRDGRLRRLTEDHTYVGQLVRQGRLSATAARGHPHGHVLTRALGIEPEVRVDVEEGRAQPGDRFLLATDGLTAAVEEVQVASHVAEDTPERATEALIEAALRGGAPDNVTVVVVEAREGVA